MDVSVIIVNWNTKDVLRNCLKSIYDQTNGIDFEVLIVDNASTDGSVEMIRKEFPHTILIKHTENRGFAAGNNSGMALAKGRYVLLLNSDTIVCDGATQKVVRYADKHPEAAVVGCQVWEDCDKIQMTCFRFPSCANLLLSSFGLAKIFKHNKLLGRELILWWNRDSEREVDVVSGMFMMVRREAIERVGMMDEAFFMYCEEADWCYRFRKAGWEVLFWPGARIVHLDGGSYSSNKVAVKMFVQKQRSLLIFMKKHSGTLSCLLSRFILIFSFSLRICFWTISLTFNRLQGKRTNNCLEEIRKRWAAFKFCALAIRPK